VIEIGGLTVVDSWSEYAVDVDGAIIECEDLAEVELICSNDTSVTPIKRKGYITEWEPLALTSVDNPLDL
jgi:hypothetical protein